MGAYLSTCHDGRKERNVPAITLEGHFVEIENVQEEFAKKFPTALRASVVLRRLFFFFFFYFFFFQVLQEIGG